MAAAASQGDAPPTIVAEATNALGLSSLDPATLIGLTGAIAALLLILKSIVSLLLVRLVFRFLADRSAGVSASLSSKFFACDLTVVQSRPSQEIAYALGRGTNAAVLNILGAGMVLISEVTLLALLGAALLFIDPIVTIGAIAFFVIVAGFLQRPLSRWAGRLGSTMAEADIAAITLVQEGVAGYREVSVLDRRDYYRSSYRDQRYRSAGAIGDMQFMSMVPKNTMEVAMVLGALVLALAQFMTQDATVAIATLVVFLAAASRVMPSLLRMQGALATAHASRAAAVMAYDLADMLGQVAEPPRTSHSALEIRQRIADGNPNFDPRIEVRSISVTYPGSTVRALDDVSISLTSGKSLALVGSTGAGKSTLADVILGVIEPDDGLMLIGGIAPRSASKRWSGAIAYVPQDVALTQGTVRANVALGLPPEAIDDDLVWGALDRAHLADFLRSQREGIDTLVGERGVRLSGGQRQRLGLARGLYSGPRLLVLDEATSALDAETERAIADTLAGLEGYVTTVTIAHRLATVRHADVVAYMESGRIVACGTFDEVRVAVPSFNHQAKLLGL